MFVCVCIYLYIIYEHGQKYGKMHTNLFNIGYPVERDNEMGKSYRGKGFNNIKIYIYIYIYVNYMNAHVFIYVCRAMCGKVAVIIMCIAS